MRKRSILFILWQLFVLILCYLLVSTYSFAADDSLCARVKIEIKQELTLERQAFDAHMRINNGLTHITLENVDVEVTFADAEGNTVRASYDPDDTDALFFIRLDSMQNINRVDGAGTVQPSTSADIHWLIIPAPGASNGMEQGTLYYVGAILIYTIGGEEYVTEVTPDYIFVKPMPMLFLDYFLPTDVYGDDAFTTDIEPPIPFSLGVRVKNDGYGAAKKLKIDSAQPKIIENELGLLINFVIEGCEVNGGQAANTLLADFGDIQPQTSGVARWIMICTLSGQFIEFEAEFTHADELGGELTSLIEAVNTHFLVRDVMVDLPGRDNVRDFLAKDGEVYRVYESDSTDTEVIDHSAYSVLNFQGESDGQFIYKLYTPFTAGFIYVQLPDPQGGQKVLYEVVRSDGKRIKTENAWLSKTRNEDHTWRHLLNLFDVNTTHEYTVVFGEPADVPHPPVLQFIPDRTRVEEEQLSFIIEASDPDGTVPILKAQPLPPGASFTDQGNGEGIFDWTPTLGQAGQYPVTFTASDGELKDSQRAIMIITSLVSDSDNDGLPDDWELEHFLSLDRDGDGDFDGDGLSNMEEFQNDMDPGFSNAPSVPIIESPLDGAEIVSLQPDLVIVNSKDPEDDAVTYTFEIYSDQGITALVSGEDNVAEGADTTSWTVPVMLNDNTWYYWRVRAMDGLCFSQWAYGSFFVNTENDPPGTFHISSPGDGSHVDNMLPVLEITNSDDPDGDIITYEFDVYEDEVMSILVAAVSQIPEGAGGRTVWTVDTLLNDNTTYYWKVIAIDEHGDTSETMLSSFFVNTFNDAPTMPVISSPEAGTEVTSTDISLAVENASDLDGDVLEYHFEMDTVDSFDSPDLEASGAVTQGADHTTWDVSGLMDNTFYSWRVKASDGVAESGWALGYFFINTENDPPTIPVPRNPGQMAWVETLTPQLELNTSMDVDFDQISYDFEVYLDADTPSLVAQGSSGTANWTVPSALSDNTWYFWKANAVDEHGLASGWMDDYYFFTNNNGVDDSPTITVTEPSSNITEGENSILISWEDSDPDSNADIALYYDTDSSGEDGMLIQQGIKEDPDGEDDTCLWDISGTEEGVYYIYATIADESSSSVSYAPGAITIDRTEPVVSASPPGGTYNSAQSITLIANEESAIYYTIDGSDPTIDSLEYVSPIEITQTTTIKCMAIDRARNQSSIVTEIYEINYLFEVDAGPDQTVDEGTTVSFSGTLTDPDSVSYTIEWDFGDDNSCSGNLTPTHKYIDNGVFTVTLTVTDDNENIRIDTLIVTVENVAPTVSAGNDWTVGEGELISFSGGFTDPGADTHSIVWDFGDGFGAVDILTPTHIYEDNGYYVATLTVIDDDTDEGMDDVEVAVNNVAPDVGEITAPLDPIQMNTNINTLAYFTDSGVHDTHAATWDWGDGSTSTGELIEYAGSGSVTGVHSYANPGVYTVKLTVTDNDSDSNESIFQYIVIFDPEGGFVTGGGWIDSPEGAYAFDLLLTGKASFGFVSKYQKGINIPTGETEFNFRVADLNFHSDSYDWLVVARALAQYKGTGTINGGGNYGFMLTAIDAALTPNTDADLFRIKIWDIDNDDYIVYDNQMGDSDDAGLITIIGGGSIVIHK